MKSKKLFQLCIILFFSLMIMLLGGYEYVKAQTWTALPPYNFLWPLWSPALSPMSSANGLSSPTLASLTTLPNITQSLLMPQTPLLSFDDLLYTREANSPMDVMDWQQRVNMETTMPIMPSYPLEYGNNMFGLQSELPDIQVYNGNYGSEFMHEWQGIQWNPYSYPGRFAPARIRNTLYEFTSQIPEQNLYPLPDKWQPIGAGAAVPGGGGGWGLSGGGWLTQGAIGGSWLPYGGLALGAL